MGKGFGALAPAGVWRVLAGMLALAVVALVYWPGLGGPFVFDDFPALVSNRRLHVEGLDWAALWRAATSFDPGGTGRQLAMASFALNHALGGLDPWGWKLGGVLVHLLNSALVYLLCRRVLALAGVVQYLRLSAAALALAWAVHPLQVSTVLYVVQRMETLCLTFTLLALLAYLRGRCAQLQGRNGWGWIAACVPLFLLALGAKETALLLPLYTLALELALLHFGAAGAGQRRFWRWGYAAGCAAGLVLFVLVVIPHYTTAEAYAIRDFNAWERVLSQLRILPLYLGQILLPLPASMTFYYDDFVASTSLLQPWTTLAGGVLLAALLGAAFALRRRAPLATLGILWFFAAHAITSNVIALELVFEHRNYFALLGVLLVLAELIRRLPVRDGPGIKLAGITAVLVLLGFLGAVRAATWGDRLLLATELVDINPGSARAAHELGVLYHRMSDGSAESPFFSFAVRTFERESQLPSASILAEQSLILMHAAHGLPVDPGWWDQLLQRLRTQPITPQVPGALFDLLDARLNKGVELDDAALLEAFVIVFDRMQMPPTSHFQVGLYALEQGHDLPLARQLLARAWAGAVDYPEFRQYMRDTLHERGQSAVADWLEQR